VGAVGADQPSAGLTLILNGFNTSKVIVEDVDHIGLGKFVR
jgi:hypothetical protein